MTSELSVKIVNGILNYLITILKNILTSFLRQTECNQHFIENRVYQGLRLNLRGHSNNK